MSLPLTNSLTPCICDLQVVYWDVLEKKYASEVSQQQEVFSGEQGDQRHKDFKYAAATSSIYLHCLVCFIVFFA